MLKKWWYSWVIFLSSSVLFGQDLNLSHIFIDNTFRPNYVWGLRSLPGGEAYSKLVFDRQNGTSYVVSYSYATGAAIDTLIRYKKLASQVAPTPVSTYFGYTFSKDMSRALIAVQEESIYRYSSKAHYYVMDLSTDSVTKLTDGAKQMYATFSPDGEKVAYVQENDLFYKDLVTGEITQITRDGKWNHIINGASDWVYEEELTLTRAFEWSPDSKRIVYFRFDESEVPVFNMQTYKEELYPGMYSFKYPKAGEANAVVTVWGYTLGTGQPTDYQLSTGTDHYFPRLEWTHDPRYFTVQRLNRLQNELDILYVNAITGEHRILLHEENPYYIDVTDNLTFLENGEQFLWTSEQDGYHHIYLFNIDGTLERQLTKGKFDVTAFYGVDEEEGYVYYQSAEQSPLERHIYRVNLKGRKKEKLTTKPGWHDADFSANNAYYIETFTSREVPYTFGVYDAAGELERELVNNEPLKDTTEKYGFVEKTFFTVPLPDTSLTLNGWMMKPKDFDPAKQYPVFMYVYGGPGSQTVQNRWGGRREYWFQYLTQQGYIVVSVDNRGTGARGQAFQKTTYQKLGVLEVEDQIAAARYLAGLDYVDGDRIGIFGWSYGGFMSSGCLFRAPDVFKMAIAVAPVTHWKFYDTIYTERYMRTPQENPDGYDAGSPINYVDGLRGDFLLIHGTGDDNVHFQNSVELVRALVAAGKDFDVFYYPDKAHGLGGRMTTLHLYRQMSDYIMENL